MRFLIDTYNAEVKRLANQPGADIDEAVDKTIKWTRAVKRDLEGGKRYTFASELICDSYYRPFVKRKLYFSRQLNEMVYQVPQLFRAEANSNRAFAFSAEERSEFGVIALDVVPNKDIFMPSAAQVVARFRHVDGTKIDNITDWALDRFRAHYEGAAQAAGSAPSPLAGEGGRCERSERAG